MRGGPTPTVTSNAFLDAYRGLSVSETEATKAQSFIDAIKTADPDATLRVLGDTDLDEAAEAAAVKLGITKDEFVQNLFKENLPRAEAPTFKMPIMGTADDAVPSPNRTFYETYPAADEAIEALKAGIR